jgi:SH3-like domain-containing protein
MRDVGCRGGSSLSDGRSKTKHRPEPGCAHRVSRNPVRAIVRGIESSGGICKRPTPSGANRKRLAQRSDRANRRPRCWTCAPPTGALAWVRTRGTMSSIRWHLVALIIVCVAPAANVIAASPEQVATGSASGLPVPRFVSLKSDRVNVRSGPSKDHDVVWVYSRSALPVEVTAEFENWRRIRDWEGAEGWVYHSLLSGRRTAIVSPGSKTKDDLLPLRSSADHNANVTARLQPGVQGTVKRCTGNWCRIVGEGFDGFIEQDRLWGVYPNEQIE